MSEEQFLDVAVEAAKNAGEIIRKGFYQTKNVEHKGQVDLVTETDKACEDLIFNHLRKHFPDHKFIGEETSAALGATADLTDEPTWIVDPLDGTTNFVHGFPFVCVSIGLTIGKIPTVGVVYNPIMNEVSNWFINARVRLWKPMIEEMYQQECRELEGSSAGGVAPESGNDPSGADDTHSPTTTGAVAQQLPQQHGTAAPGMMMPHKPDPGAAGPSAADAAFVGIDPVELLGGDAHVGGGAADLYGRFEPGVRMRYGPGATGAAAGDVSLTLGLQHAGAGNAGPDGTGRFSLRDYSGC